jgi:hypothetical protein
MAQEPAHKIFTSFVIKRDLLKLKYHAISDAEEMLGIANIRNRWKFIK